MKKKLLKKVIPLSIAAVLLIGLLIFFLIPPKKSNFRFDLHAYYLDENEHLIDEAKASSYREEEKSFFVCPVESTIQFQMMLGQQDRRRYKTVYKGT